MKIGANYSGHGNCEFIVWAPFCQSMEAILVSPSSREIRMEKDDKGYWRARVEDVEPGAFYYFRIQDGRERPDPASNYQPKGVHGPSGIVDHASFPWDDADWKGIALEEMIIYELHVGTFTPKGDFDSVIYRIPDLKELGINTIGLMPVAQFPGKRNWGYDGAYPFAVQNSYGGPDELKKLVNACHQQGMAVVLDVVYNHLGPEGNYFREYGPYFTRKYKTPWGEAVNFDDEYSDEVRNYFIENTLFWFEQYHVDALRLDSVHAIFDMSAQPFLKELAGKTDEFSAEKKRQFLLIAESNLNDTRILRPREEHGYGLAAQWSDDFHHSVHTLLTAENDGYYADFGKVSHLVKALKKGFVYDGQYSIYRQRRHGNSSADRPGRQFVVSIQTHDQVGNRMLGERLTQLVSFEALKLAAGIMLLSPYVPMLFMGEEYGEEAPFLYFVNHGDPGLVEAVRKGRKEEFQSFRWQGEPPDPQSIETFKGSKLNWEKREEGKGRVLLDLYRELLHLRREIPVLSRLNKNDMQISGDEESKFVLMHRREADSEILAFFNFNQREVKKQQSIPGGRWEKILDSAHKNWNGPGDILPESLHGKQQLTMPSLSFGLYLKENDQ